MAPDPFAPWFDPTHPMNQRAQRRSTIDELEAILSSEEDVAIEILPNGEIRAKAGGEREGIPKVITMRENLGGEYAWAA